MKKADLLKAALEIVEKRGLNYGTPENNFARIAALWTLYLTSRETSSSEGVVHETDVAAMMVLMKVARLMEKPDHLDSWLDIAGYAACGAEVSRAGEPNPYEIGFTKEEHDAIIKAQVQKIEDDIRHAPGFPPKPEVRGLKVGDIVVPTFTTPTERIGKVVAVDENWVDVDWGPTGRGTSSYGHGAVMLARDNMPKAPRRDEEDGA